MSTTGLIGAPIRRKEDARLLRGAGRFTADAAGGCELHAAFVRSPLAHARIRRLDGRRAAAMPGVAAVLTGADLEAAGVGRLTCNIPVTNHDGRPMAHPPRPVLPAERTLYAGEPLAVIVAATREQARDAAEAVDLDLEDAPVLADVAAAAAEGAPAIWSEAPGNRAFELREGDPAGADAAFARAARVVTLSLAVPRLVPNPLECRGILAEPDPATGGLAVTITSQSPHRLRRTLAAGVLKMPETGLRLIAPDVGGGFGGRLALLSEEVCVAFAARRLGHSVAWIADRSEGFLTDTHTRDVLADAALALDGEGHFLGLRVAALQNVGAYLSQASTVCPLEFLPSLANVYRVGAVDARIAAVFTNTTPTDVYRGVGRGEAVYVMERLVDAAARALDADPAALRRRNMMAPSAGPLRTATGLDLDSGDFPMALDLALAKADYAGFAARRAVSPGCLRGIGIAAFVQNTMGGPDSGEIETARVRVHPTGSVTLFVGTHSHGQSHATVFAQLVAARLGLGVDDVEVVFGDTGREPFGRGTYGSRSLSIGGAAIALATDKVVAKGRRIAAHLLEAAAEDVVFEAGRFQVAGTDRAVTLAQVALTAYVPHNFPHEDLEPGLDEQASYFAHAATFPNGCHVAEVEVDPETGAVRLLAYTAVDDVGEAINPLVVEGQVHGGVAQGIGEALLERAVHDPATGQLLSGSFLDYAMPRADDLVAFACLRSPTRCRTNPLGVKGAGELGSVAAPAAVMNAVLDALAPAGVATLDLPATPERVWRALAAARRA